MIPTPLRRPLLLAAASLVAASAAGAQAAVVTRCDIRDDSPFQLNSAKLYLQRAEGGGASEEKPRHLRDGVRVLTENADRIANPVGRHWLLARTLFAWTRQPNQPLTAPRASLGYTTNGAAPQDILAAIDSAFAYVENAMPACVSNTRSFRQNLWVPIYNDALRMSNGGQPDSAILQLARAETIWPRNPNTANLLGIIAQKRNDRPAMLQHFGRVLELTREGDTSFVRQRRSATAILAVLKLQEAERAAGAERGRLLQEAEAMFRSTLAAEPSNADATTGLARVLSLRGDNAAVASIGADMIASPAKYTDTQLFEAGSGMARAGRNEDAAKLFEAGLARNPHFRDALFNLAAVYHSLKDGPRATAVAQRLLVADPNHPDSYRLLAAATQLRAADAPSRTKRALNDSVVALLQKSMSHPVRVTVSQFQHAGPRHTVAGRIENLGAGERSYALAIEFLDATGKVVAEQTVNVGPVAPKQALPFTATVTQDGIVAWRTRPLG